MTTVTEHSELVEEMQQIERLPVVERVKLAQKRRKQQLLTHTKWVKTDTTSKPKQKSSRGVHFSRQAQIMDVAARSSYDEMRSLLKNGCDPNIKNHDGLTALHQCCIDGSSEMVTLLLKHGANVNITDQDLWTPLHAAATCGHFEIVKILVKAGASVTAVNGDGDVPLDITEDEVTLQYLKNELAKRGISEDDLHDIRQGPQNIILKDVRSILTTKADLNQPLEQGETILHVAIANGYNNIVELLLNNGASPTVSDKDGWQPIHVAAYWSNEDALHMLLYDTKVNIRAKTAIGETPYELCDDDGLKMAIRHALSEQSNSDTDSSMDKEHDGDVTDIHGDDINREDSETVIDSGSPVILRKRITLSESDDLLQESSDDTLGSPLINLEATELLSDRRNSFKDVKHNAPLKRMSSERGSNRSKQRNQNNVEKSLQGQENFQAFYVIKEDSPLLNNHQDYNSFFNNSHHSSDTQPPKAAPQPLKLEPQPPPPTYQLPELTSQPPAPTPEPLAPTPKPPAPTPEPFAPTPKPPAPTPEPLSPETQKLPQVGDVMVRPRKKMPAPPPPRGSLQDLKRQRQEEREQQLQRDQETGKRSPLGSNFYESDGQYEPPPSPTAIRYRYKMVAEDNTVNHKIFREKKCIVM